VKNQQQQFEEACQRFERFNRRGPKKGEIIWLGGLVKPTIGLKVGTFVGIAYKSLDGIENMHYFEGRRPLVFVNSDGNQIYPLGGEYRFTERGFLK
jgi:hypothetical protein